MKKQEFIDRYGEEAYKRKLESDKASHKKWCEKNEEKYKSIQKKCWHNWYEKNKDRHKSNNRQYEEDNKEAVLERANKYRSTKYGRAGKIMSGYKSHDKKYGLVDGFNLSHQWIIDHIFNSSCVYCGETNWLVLGCDRIDNTKAHSTDNCVCACSNCNTLRQDKDFKTFLLSQNPSGASDILTSLGLQPTPRTESQGN